jgi:hypothetical protein
MMLKYNIITNSKMISAVLPLNKQAYMQSSAELNIKTILKCSCHTDHCCGSMQASPGLCAIRLYAFQGDYNQGG